MIRYDILQITDSACKYTFMNYDFALNHGFNLRNYSAVYSGSINADPESHPFNILENLFCIFNQRRPSDFYGHSLSMSDIVILHYADKPSRFFYCDRFGWVELVGQNDARAI